MSASDLDGRIALITGAAGGIGQPLARAFVGAGMRVALCDTSEDGVRRLHAELGADRTIALPTDVSDPAACRDSVSRTIARFGRLDVLVNNAAVGMSTVRADHMRPGRADRGYRAGPLGPLVAVNLSGRSIWPTPAVPGHARPQIRADHQRHHQLFHDAQSRLLPYGPAKCGLEGWSTSLAGELKGSGITVNVVVPAGRPDTPMVPDDGTMERSQLIRPEKMAPPMLHLASDAGGGVTGMRFVAAKWESSLSVADAIAASGAPAGWPDLARSPVWPGGGPKR